jgi:tetratricopeptide (TPR) repeat protein
MKSNSIALSALFLGLFLTACQPFRNFSTYYNRFYNMERIMDEAEDELLYIREQKIPEPSYYIPYDEQGLKGARVYSHLERRSMTAEESKANKIKLDSILIKGSMLMARNSKSDYVPDAVFYIAKTYFYEREWYQSQKKCEEFIASFPDSRWLPDAHLFLAMDLLHQADVEGAERMLSRAIDIAWGQERRDVLVEAFRLNADINLARGDFEKAVKPYRRALLLSSDNEDKARWQYEIGVVYFRGGDFDSALREFDKVGEFSPDVLTQFQTGIQRSVTLRTLGKYDDAALQLDKLAGNGNFEDWRGMVELERMNLAADRPSGTVPTDQELHTLDSTYPGKTFAAYGIYERGVRAFRAGDYKTAYENFLKVQSAMAPFQRKAQRYAILLGRYHDQLGNVATMTRIPVQTYPDSIKAEVSDAYYNVARVFASFDLPDSINRYYMLSSKWALEGSVQAARGIYARAAVARDKGHNAESDSLLELLVHNYALTEYAVDARSRLGYTEDAMKDPARTAYQSGASFMKVGEYANALPKFQTVASKYKDSPYAPQALYAIGLIYEQHIENYDSAFAYYTRILSSYPNSEQAATVRPIIDAVLTARTRQGAQLPADSSKVGETPASDSTGTRKIQLNADGLIPLGESDFMEGGFADQGQGGNNAAMGRLPNDRVVAPNGGAVPPNGQPIPRNGQIVPPRNPLPISKEKRPK